MKLSEELRWRGLVHQTTFKSLDEINNPQIIYFGIDPSADSLTIGHLAPLILLKIFAKYGHKVFILLGGASALIGDPDGKKQERDLQELETIKNNKILIKKQIQKLFEKQNINYVDNLDWFKEIRYIDFLRSIGKHLSMSQLLDREFIKQRIGSQGSGISYAEFSYSLIQGYDFLHLNINNGVNLQIAGSDQWGNSLSGVELIRKVEGKRVNVLTMPLIINKETGIKFGKSEEGAIWLDQNKTSAFQFYQYWINLDDQHSKQLIKIFTDLSVENINEIIDQHDEKPEKRLLQQTIAKEVSTTVHGEQRTKSIIKITNALFGNLNFNDLADDELKLLSEEIKTVNVGDSISKILLDTGITKSLNEGRKLIINGAISINFNKITEDITIEKSCLIKKGKNTFIYVK